MAEGRGGFVLLVDEDYSVRELLSRYLEEAGYEPLHARDGLHALGILRNRIPKVIISDLVMPRMSGIEFIGVVRRRFPTIPVIAFVGSMPHEFPAGTQPDRLFEKGGGIFPELIQAVDELARNAPNDAEVQQEISVPIRIGPGSNGNITLTCPNCLPMFAAQVAVEVGTMAPIAVCTHCEARVPFLIVSSASA
jgi:CheY-like chemotaxis protein